MISDIITQILERMLSDEDGTIEIRRNDFAREVGCVPSQINYVITSRFTPERGYMVESRRGGGGYVRIIKKEFHKDGYMMHFFHAIGGRISSGEAKIYVVNLYEKDLINEREAKIIQSALSAVADDAVRAEIFKKIVLALI